MIVIHEVRFYETEQDMATLESTRPDTPIRTYDFGVLSGSRICKEIQMELIRGRRYVRDDGTTLVIGAPKQAQEVMGIMFDAWAEKDIRQQETAGNLVDSLRLVRDLERALDLNMKAHKKTTVALSVALLAALGLAAIFSGVLS